MLGPCGGWEPDDCECTPEAGAEHVAAAQFILWGLTGKRYGLCDVVVRPCSLWQCQTRRRCCGSDDVILPGPVVEITEVLVDGVALADGDYRVDNHHILVSHVGPWPSCQNFSDPAPGSLQVSYVRGLAPPPGAGLMVAELACELAKAACNDSSCRLPKRIQSKSRQGVTVVYDDFVADMTGLFMVDAWVAQANKPQRVRRVWTPDIPEPRFQTWPEPGE